MSDVQKDPKGPEGVSTYDRPAILSLYHYTRDLREALLCLECSDPLGLLHSKRSGSAAGEEHGSAK